MPSETLVVKPDAPGAPRVHVERVRTREVEPTLTLTPPTPDVATPAGNAAAAAEDAHIAAAIEKAHAEDKGAAEAATPEPAKPRAPDGKFLPKVDAEIKAEPKPAKVDAKPEAKAEPPKPEAPKVSAEEQRVVAGMNAVAREERRLTQEKQAFKAERAQMAATVEAANAKLAEVTSLLASAKSDPIAFLQRTGLVVEDVIRAAVADPSKVQTAATREQSELAEIRKLAEEAKAAAGSVDERINKAKAEAQREGLTNQLAIALQQNAETYEATLAEFGDNAATVILGYIDDMKAQGETVDLRTAVDRIEEHCVGVWKARKEKADALKKIRTAAPATKVEDVAAALAPKDEPKPTKANGSPTTITRDTASAAPSPERHRRGGLQRDFDDIEALTQSYRRAKGK